MGSIERPSFGAFTLLASPQASPKSTCCPSPSPKLAFSKSTSPVPALPEVPPFPSASPSPAQTSVRSSVAGPGIFELLSRPFAHGAGRASATASPAASFERGQAACGSSDFGRQVSMEPDSPMSGRLRSQSENFSRQSTAEFQRIPAGTSAVQSSTLRPRTMSLVSGSTAFRGYPQRNSISTACPATQPTLRVNHAQSSLICWSQQEPSLAPGSAPLRSNVTSTSTLWAGYVRTTPPSLNMAVVGVASPALQPATPILRSSPMLTPVMSPGSPTWTTVSAPRRRQGQLEPPPLSSDALGGPPQVILTRYRTAGDCAELYYDQKELFVKGWTRDAKQSRSVKMKKRVDYQVEKRRQQSARDRSAAVAEGMDSDDG